jgi:bla regulator protein BlaR1
MRQNAMNGGDMVIDAQGITIEEFRKNYLSGSPLAGLDRRVVDNTGLTGRFDIHLRYAPPSEFASLRRRGGNEDPDSTAPSIFTAVQEQLGLKLDPAKEPQEILVIDHMERPSENC